MIIILKHNIILHDKENLRNFLETKGFKVREIIGEEETVFGAVGNISIDIRQVEILPGVSRVIPISKPYKLVSRELKKENTIVKIGRVKIGGNRVAIIAGPCAVESKEQIFKAAEAVRKSGAVMLRGGAFKPRTSPYSFQGMGEEGLKILKEAGDSVGLPVVSEIVGTDYVEMMKDYVDAYQIGARNMQNFELLKAVGKMGMPVLLKRGLSATIEEWLMAAEYLMAHGSDNIILCERGIRTFETYTRNTLDLSAIPVVKKLSHLPIIVDPSHATGIRAKVAPMALAAIAAGADGLIVEVHPDPDHAMSDGPQSLYPEEFEKLMRDIQALSPVVGKEIERIPEDRPISVQSTDNSINKNISFQGIRGAYSEKAIHSYFGDEVTALAQHEFRDVFESVLQGSSLFGVIPVENSLAGTINENIDLLLRYPDIAVVGEYKLRITHNLIGLPGSSLENIKKVYSHPQGLAQCADFIEKHEIMEGIPYYDTAGAVANLKVLNDISCGAIAGEEAARVYGMHIIKESIETNPRNYTKFFIISRTDKAEYENPNRAAIVFSTPDKPGALFNCLKVLAEGRINMNKLESRPIPGKPWQYMFFLSVDLNDKSESFEKTLNEFRQYSEDLRVLGKYRIN
ncbi:MAG: 3-deoxy-7-phosphoheptulonate synthase [Spirochaetaceae bacterium]|nr:3-deoxy-7-phosphoheptulonate synthase [Spirochaetaceae bacterium]